MLYQPNKIVAGGELVLLEAIMWNKSGRRRRDGFAVPANVQLGLRHFRVSLTGSTSPPGRRRLAS